MSLLKDLCTRRSPVAVQVQQDVSLQYLLYSLCWQWQACAIVNQILQGRSSVFLHVYMYLIKLYWLSNEKLFCVDLTGGACGFIFFHVNTVLSQLT